MQLLRSSVIIVAVALLSFEFSLLLTRKLLSLMLDSMQRLGSRSNRS